MGLTNETITYNGYTGGAQRFCAFIAERLHQAGFEAVADTLVEESAEVYTEAEALKLIEKYVDLDCTSRRGHPAICDDHVEFSITRERDDNRRLFHRVKIEIGNETFLLSTIFESIRQARAYGKKFKNSTKRNPVRARRKCLELNALPVRKDFRF